VGNTGRKKTWAEGIPSVRNALKEKRKFIKGWMDGLEKQRWILSGANVYV